jgi:hypothetical protein
MTEYSRFAKRHLRVIKDDVVRAQRLSAQCSNVLLAKPRWDGRVVQLLRDTFRIDDRDQDKIEFIRNRFFNFGERIQRTTFAFNTKPRKKGELDNNAYVDLHPLREAGAPPYSNKPLTEIFIRPGYFDLSLEDRAVLLIHEYIHLLQRPGEVAHPDAQGKDAAVMKDLDATSGKSGKDQPWTPDMDNKLRPRLGIPYDKAVRNPYCYEYFARWLKAAAPPR